MRFTPRHAVWLALATAAISGTSNFINKIAVTAVKEPVTYTFLKNGLVAVLLVGVMVLTWKFRELRTLRRADCLKLIAIAIVGGSVPFILFFTGLTLTSAVSAGFIHKTLFLWVALLAVPLLKERIGILQACALILLLAGNILLGGYAKFHFGRGELLVLAATLLWAVENIIAKKALANISSLTVAGARMIIGSFVLLFVVAWQGHLNLITSLSPVQWSWTLVATALLFGYVVTWFTALKHAPATLVASLLVPATLVTNLLSLIFLDKRLSAPELASGGLLIAAAVLLVWSGRRAKPIQSYARSRSAEF